METARKKKENTEMTVTGKMVMDETTTATLRVILYELVGAKTPTTIASFLSDNLPTPTQWRMLFAMMAMG